MVWISTRANVMSYASARGEVMSREYDLFESMPDGSFQWHGFENGLEEARQRLRVLNLETENNCFAIDIRTNEIVASCTGSRAKVE
jgi:hypothetical protein